MEKLTRQHNIGNLNYAVTDVHYTTQGGLFKANYYDLLEQLNALMGKDLLLPKEYQSNVLKPFIGFISSMDPADFNKIFQSDENLLSIKERGLRKLIPRIAETLLQRNFQGVYYQSAYHDLKAFQAVVTSLYAHITAINVQQITKAILPPLVGWHSSISPHTVTVDRMQHVGIKVGIVILPAVHRTGGILAWASLGHEIAGHNFLRSNPNLLKELQDHVYKAILHDFPNEDVLANYWKLCTEEVASDILGTLNIGPVWGVSLIGHLRGVRGGTMRNQGPYPSTQANPKGMLRLESNPKGKKDIWIDELTRTIEFPRVPGVLGKLNGKPNTEVNYKAYLPHTDKHPVDVIRPFVILTIIEMMEDLAPDEKEQWISVTRQEAERDLPATTFNFHEINTSVHPPIETSHFFNKKLMIDSAEVVAKAILTSSLLCLGNLKIRDIFNWTDNDQLIVDQVREGLTDPNQLRLIDQHLEQEKFYGRYVIAAAVQEALTQGSDIEMIFTKMKHFLKDAYDRSPTWNPGEHITIKIEPLQDSEEIFALFDDL